jgi:hypothetical protein
MESTSQLVWAMLFGSIGVGFFVYGKKQKVVMPLVAGIALMCTLWSLLVSHCLQYRTFSDFRFSGFNMTPKELVLEWVEKFNHDEDQGVPA